MWRGWVSRSNGGEGREANPKVCASIIGAPQTVTHFSLFTKFKYHLEEVCGGDLSPETYATAIVGLVVGLVLVGLSALHTCFGE